MPRRKDRPVRHSYHYEGNYPEASIRRTDCRNLLEAGPLPFYPFTVEETRRSNRFLFRGRVLPLYDHFAGTGREIAL